MKMPPLLPLLLLLWLVLCAMGTAHAAPKCADCGRAIRGEYAEVAGKTFHPEHLRCSECRVPLDRKGLVHEAGAKLLCWTCFEKKRPQCDDCQRRLIGRSAEVDGRRLCVACYEQRLPRCDICGRLMEGEAIRNGWGDTYCAVHQEELPQCVSCKRLISERLTGGGERFPDGRIHCNLCREGAIDELRSAQRLFERARFFLEHEGFALYTGELPLKLAGADEIGADAPGMPQDMRGHTLVRRGVHSDGTIELEIEVRILYGLPAEEFLAVAVHELGHTWVAEQNLLELDPVDHEGFCELLSYLWLAEQTDPRSRFYLEMMQRGEDNVYAVGLHKALQALESLTPLEIANYLTESGRLPE